MKTGSPQGVSRRVNDHQAPSFMRERVIPAYHACDGADDSSPLAGAEVGRHEKPGANHRRLGCPRSGCTQNDLGARVARNIFADTNPWVEGGCCSKSFAIFNNPARAVFEKAMQGHVLAHTERAGLYRRR